MPERERTKEELKIGNLVADAIRKFNEREKDNDGKEYGLDQAAFDALAEHLNDPYHLLSIMFSHTKLKPSDAYDLNEIYEKENLGSFVSSSGGEEDWENVVRAFLTPLLVQEMLRKDQSLEVAEMGRMRIR
jgi:hypothetical protein